MKKFILVLLLTFFISTPALALELDLSVDEEIKKKYNSNKLNEEVLPTLPKTVNTPSKGATNSTSNSNKQTSSTKTVNVTPVENTAGAKIPAWTKFQVKSNVKINDWLAEGSSISFTSIAPVYKKYVTIPTGTTFKGIITDIHRPQITGNGGLVEIKIVSMNLNGKTINLNGKITKANGKKIFFNNIKGEHQYFDGVKKQIDKGENFYQKTRQTSANLSSNPVGTIISPIPTVAGWIGYAVCAVASPITGLASKGNSISIPEGSYFEIKLLDNAYTQ